MDESLSTWLALREAADWTSRSASLVARVAEALPLQRPLVAIDLCAGTGSNLRYLMDRLPAGQRWLAVDRDEALLVELRERLASWAHTRGYRYESDSSRVRIEGTDLQCEVEVRRQDLGSLDAGLFSGCQLVTASALLDLVSTSWLRRLADHCRMAGAAVLFAMTYDGRFSCEPLEPEDDMVRDFFNRHQRTDKGLGGPAAGPEAWQAAVHAFRDAGYYVEHTPSDWSIDAAASTDASASTDAEAHEFQRQLIDGWAAAAAAIAPHEAVTIARWRERRLAHLRAHRSRIVVHHYDVAGWPRPSSK